MFDAQGAVTGTIGGGVVEGEVQRRAPDVIADGQPLVLDFDLTSRGEEGGQSVCGGTMRVLLDPTATGRQEVLAAAADAAQTRCRAVLVTRICQRDTWQVESQLLPADDQPWPDTAYHGTLREALRTAACLHIPAHVNEQGESEELLVEPILPVPTLLLVGGGHVSQAVAVQAQLVGFEVVVIDDRPEFVQARRFPHGTTTLCASPPETLVGYPFDEFTFVVIVTRGHQHDVAALAACVHAPAAYIGMIGSQRKVAWARRQLAESQGVTAEQFARVYAPIGLEIGAVTVPEIAASIVAQLVAVRRLGAAPRISAPVNST